MAELALGLTKTVVEGVLNRVQSAIDEENKLQDGVQQDLAFITGEFQMMQSFLKVANRERAKKNEVVRAWVRQLRDLAFDVEDWVELVAHLDNDKSSCFFRMVPSWAVPRCLAPPRELDDAASEMKLLKSRVEDVSQRNTRYNLFTSNDSGSGLDFKAITPPSTGPNLSSVALHVVRQVWRETDKYRHTSNLQNLITRQVGGDDIQVIWLWGTKNADAPSSAIDKAYNDPEICRWFSLRAWVRITRPFKIEEFLNTLQAQLLPVASSHLNQGLTSLELIQQVTKEQRYLVVLEHVFDLAEWNTIRTYLPDNMMGSRIVVSTQQLGFALRCTGRPYLVSELDGLPSVCAIYRKISGQSDTDTDILERKVKHGGVISVYGDGPRKSSVVKALYRSILQNRGEADGVRFGFLRWVSVVSHHPFDLGDFARRLLLRLDYYGFYGGVLKELYDIFQGTLSFLHKVLFEMEEEDVVARSRELLTGGDNCLLVIDGLQSTDEWDAIKSTILPEPPKCCVVVVVTDDASVARYCIDGNEDRLVHIKQGCIFSCRRERALAWIRSICDRSSLQERWNKYVGRIYACITNLYLINTRPVLSVWGIAGVGKSALVRWAFTKSILDPYNVPFFKFDYYCWVDVSHPFSLAELSLCLLLECFSHDLQAKEVVMVGIIQGQDPIELARAWLQQHVRWLLVLDGLQSTDEWDSLSAALGLSTPTNESRIIVITNEQSVAMHCVDGNKKQLLSVQGLQADAALCFFNQKIGNINSHMERVVWEQVSKSIVARCGGLPKVIAAVAEYCDKLIRGDIIHLQLEKDKFMHTLEGFRSLRCLFSWMQSYLETCKDDLKPCIFYLQIFPIDHKIRLRRLLWRWIAEGYSRDTSNHTAAENGERLFYELLDLSIIQRQPEPLSKPLKQYRVNGFFHEYITSRPMEDNLVFALEGHCRLNSQRVGQHLSVRSSWDKDKNVFESTDFSRLRSLTVFGECLPFMFDPDKIKMRHVRVLDLEDSSGATNADLEHIVELLPRLKFLSLRGCKNITHLPKSLGSLRQLQTLDIRHTSIATLPEAIVKLQKLQYVRAGTIHSVPWDEGGTMVPCEQTAPEGANSSSDTGSNDDFDFDIANEEEATSVAPAEDATTAAVVIPMATVEDTTAVAGAPLAPPAPRTPAHGSTLAAGAPGSRPHDLLPSWLSKLCCRRRHDNTNVGVEVPAGIGNLTSLHTFGVAAF